MVVAGTAERREHTREHLPVRSVTIGPDGTGTTSNGLRVAIASTVMRVLVMIFGDETDGLCVSLLVCENTDPTACQDFPLFACGIERQQQQLGDILARRAAIVAAQEEQMREHSLERIRIAHDARRAERAAAAREWQQQQNENGSLPPRDPGNGRVSMDPAAIAGSRWTRGAVDTGINVGDIVPLAIEEVGRAGDPVGIHRDAHGRRTRIYVKQDTDCPEYQRLRPGEGVHVCITEVFVDIAYAVLATPDEIAVAEAVKRTIDEAGEPESDSGDDNIADEIVEPLRGTPIVASGRQPVEPRQNCHHRVPDSGDGNGGKRWQPRSNGRRRVKRHPRY